jgi:hypothetical protein
MYDVGDVITLPLSVTDGAGNPADGGTVTVTVGLPDGTTATPVVAPGDTGQYSATFTAVLEGLHTVRWTVTAGDAIVPQDVFNVREITDQIIGLAEARKQLRFTGADFDDDLRLFIAAAGKAVEDHTGVALVRRTITEKLDATCGKLWLTKTPVLSITSLEAVNGSATWDTAHLDVRDDLGLVRALTGPTITGYVRSVYIPGTRVIPPNFLLACRIITEHLWQTMRPFASSTVPMVGALDDSLDARTGGLVGFAIPNRALELLGKPPPMIG